MGEKRWRKLIIAAGILAAFFIQTPVTAAGEDCEVEQISLDMPEVRVYYRASEPDTSYEAYLGGEKLSFDSVSLFSDLGEGVDYYFMLDVSKSIPDGQFANIKEGLIDFISLKGQQDKCMLLTFGNESRLILDGSESSEDAAAAVHSLQNEDMETVLFQSIVQAAGMIDQAAQSEKKRRVIVTVTDGEDCVTGKATAAEALNTLKKKGIPLYAMAVDVGKEEYINSFGEFARNTGGTLSIYSQGESREILDGIRNTIQNSYAADFHSNTNIASNQKEDFTIKFTDHKVVETKEVIPTRSIPDTKAPQVRKISVKGDNEIRLVFSEPVLGADSQGNYKVEKDGKAVAIGSVFYTQKKRPTAVLTFEKPLYEGTYTVSFSGITDHSMEKNALSKSCSIETELKEPATSAEFWKRWWWVPVMIISLILAAAVVMAYTMYKKIKKNKGVIYVDGKAALVSNVDVKQHVSIQNIPSKNVKLLIRDKVNGRCEMNVSINGSSIVGRSDGCDLYFDDPRMSRQHFALETDGTDVFITDLESQNGTFINGVRVNRKRKLMSNDEIAAGNMQMRILWQEREGNYGS